MQGFHFEEDGSKVTLGIVRQKEFILGNAKMQMASRGVVELSDGTVRIFSVRRGHNPNMRGHFKTLGEPLRQSFDEAVSGLRELESWWITEEVPEREGSVKSED